MGQVSTGAVGAADAGQFLSPQKPRDFLFIPLVHLLNYSKLIIQKLTPSRAANHHHTRAGRDAITVILTDILTPSSNRQCQKALAALYLTFVFNTHFCLSRMPARKYASI